MSELDELVPRLEQSIRDGHLSEVQKTLNKLNFATVPRSELSKLLNLVYRANMPFLSIRVINRLSSEDNVTDAKPTPEELIEYSAALIRVGANSEAQATLRKLDAQKYPKALLYQAFSHITEWNYADAIPYLESYLTLCHDSYSMLVGQINLAAAYTNSEKWDQAENLLTQIRENAKANDSKFIYANSLELSAQVSIHRKHYDLARKYLSEADQVTASRASIYELFTQKWITIIDLYQKGLSETNLAQLQVVYSKAMSLKHWETVRECDFYRSLFLKDEKLFLNVYFGTPFEGYRKSMLRRYGSLVSIPDTFDWAPVTKKEIRIFDCVRSMESDTVFLKKGQVQSRLLGLLLRDFYRPSRIGYLHGSLFPEDRFDGHHSVMKVQQAVKRLRAWLQENQIPAIIKSIDGGYKLIVTGAYGFRVSIEDSISNSHLLYLEKVCSHYGDDEFCCIDAARVAKVSKRLMNYLIKSDNGKSLEKISSGPSTRYRFKKTA